MERWNGRVALVTGASEGIGAAIAKDLARHGMKVVGAARNLDRLKELENEVEGSKGSLLGVKCDLEKDEDIYALFDTIKQKYGGADICVNNAGIYHGKGLLEGTTAEWRQVMNVNVIAVCLCTKLAVQSMKERNVDDGHIINVSSIGGHSVSTKSQFHFYCGTKFALKAITEGLRQELREAKSHIKASAISPGLVKTEIFRRGENDEASNRLFLSPGYLTPEDIASTVVHMISCPSHVEINDIIITPTG